MLNQVRIIGGEWRGRKLKVPDMSGLRPTPDRVRETLFNWLAPCLPGAYCLDAFAGSGALGFEALSRGAAYVLFIDQSPEVVKLLKEQKAIFKTERAEVLHGMMPQALVRPEKKFDIVFLDPPYAGNVLRDTCIFLEEKQWLAERAAIYLESANALTQADLPAEWTLVKTKKAGQVNYHLAQRT